MNQKIKWWMGAVTGLYFTAPLTALAYLMNQALGLTFPPFDAFDVLTRYLPGPLITFGIDLMIDTLRALRLSVVDTAKIAEQLMAVALFLLVGMIAGIVSFGILRLVRRQSSTWMGSIIGLFLSFLLYLIVSIKGAGSVQPPDLLWLLFLSQIWGIGLGYAFRRLSSPLPSEVDEDPIHVTQLDRRRFLIQAGTTAAAITVVGAGLALRQRRELAEGALGSDTDQKGEPRLLPNADDPVHPVPGTRPEYTEVEDHYLVFIQTEPSVVDGATWSLPITGLVENPMDLTLEELRNNYEPMDQYVTLSCISGRVGTSLIGTTLWTGVSLQDILADLNVRPEANYIQIHSADGFYETVDLDLILNDRRIMLTYDWDERPLTVEHGFPLRIYLPDRYGMKQPRWITSIEVINDYRRGYWVERGWDRDAIMQSTSVIDTVATDKVIERDGVNLVPIGGIAHAGVRGISRVEVRVDGGSWQSAQLRTPLSDLSWVIWRFEWPYEAGAHVFEVRCVEGDGTRQIEKARSARPSGSRGIHMVEESL